MDFFIICSAVALSNLVSIFMNGNCLNVDFCTLFDGSLQWVFVDFWDLTK
jgi:hypothetical protein